MKFLRVLLAVIGIVVLPGLAYSLQRWHAAHGTARDAAENLRKCRSLADEIGALQTSPTQASLQMQSQQELASLLDEAAQAAGFREGSVVRISPEANRRISKTAYVEQPTRIELRQVTMKQIVTFLDEVSRRDRRMLPASIRLSAPRATAGGAAEKASERWQAEIILTNVVFSPESRGS